MKQRIITAIFFVAAMLGGIFGGALPCFFLFVFVASGCIWELLGLMLRQDERHFLTRRLLGVALGIFPILVHGFDFFPIQYQLDAMTCWLLGIFGLFLFELFSLSEKPFSNLAAVCLGFFYITLPVTCLFEIADSSNFGYQPMRVFGILALVWVSDTVAYFVGSQLGRRKLFEKISPKKTWEGTIGGVIGTLLVAWLASQFFSEFSENQWLALGLVVSVFATLGDLVESMLKRSVGVKDSGTLLPGHGGLLDRFDAFIFVLPFCWAVLQWVD